MGSLGCTPRPLVVPLGLANISLDTIGPSRPPVCTALTNNQRTHQMLPLILGDSFDLPLDPLGPWRPTLWPPGPHWPIWSCFLVDLFISKTLDLQNPKESQQNPDSPNTLFVQGYGRQDHLHCRNLQTSGGCHHYRGLSPCCCYEVSYP